MALQLARNAESAITQFYQRDDAIAKLGELYTSMHDEVERNPKANVKPADFVHSILDVAVQKVVEKISWELLRVPDATVSSVGVPALLDLCIDGVVNKYLINSAPYKVLEDLMEGQTISNCEKLWDLLETRKEKLTTTHNSVFCGKILVFLSFTFALSERSAVNLMGKPNVANVTAFEDQDAFDSAEATDSAVAVDALPSTEIDKDHQGADAGPIDYNLYRTFWDLQRYFREHELAVQSPENWEKFFEELDVVLSAFEGNAFSSDDLERTRDLLSGGSADDEKSQDDHHHFFQPKYLTNSRLFRLQLRDPILRECMLTQFLILFNYLSKAKLPDSTVTLKSKVSEMHDRVMTLLKQTPSDGEGFSEMVARVLERERNWTKWKLEKCPPYEKYPPKADSPTKKKPSRLGDAAPLGGRGGPFVKRTRQAADSSSSLMEQILTESSKPSQILEKIKGDERATEVPMQNYLDRFTEAWDPENGIEEEYWPDKDVMHCWRTMRMSMKTSVVHLDLAINGAGAIVKGILGINSAETPKANKESAGDSVPTENNDAEVSPEIVSVKKETVNEVSSSSSVAVKRERMNAATHSANGENAPPMKRARSSERRIKEEVLENDDDAAFDYELHLLAMRFQKYQYQRRLDISKLWLIWTLLDVECYDVNARDNELRESALIVACRKKRMRVVTFLLRYGANPDGIDRSGYSALRWVVQHAHLRMLRVLLFHNASVTKKNQEAIDAIQSYRKKKKPKSAADTVGQEVHSNKEELTRRCHPKKSTKPTNTIHIIDTRLEVEHLAALTMLLQNRLDQSTGVWVKTGPGTWKSQRREAAAAGLSATTAVDPLAAASATSSSTDVVAFNPPPESHHSSAKRTPAPNVLLQSDTQWQSFLATVHRELGHQAEGVVSGNYLSIEDLE
ncbi:Tho complex subunit, partial [Globisporangium splendens]